MRWAAVAGTGAFALLISAAQAGAGTSPADHALSLANSERSARGLAALVRDDPIAAVAQAHAERMGAAGRLFHNARLGAEVAGWSAIGENVAMSNSVASAHRAFMASAPHRANILSATFTRAGAGVARVRGTIYVVEVFIAPVSTTTAIAATPPARSLPRVSLASPPKTAATRSNPVAPERRISPRRVIRSAAPAPGTPLRSVDMLFELVALSSGASQLATSPGAAAEPDPGGDRWSAASALRRHGRATAAGYRRSPLGSVSWYGRWKDHATIGEIRDGEGARETRRSRSPP